MYISGHMRKKRYWKVNFFLQPPAHCFTVETIGNCQSISVKSIAKTNKTCDDLRTIEMKCSSLVSSNLTTDRKENYIRWRFLFHCKKLHCKFTFTQRSWYLNIHNRVFRDCIYKQPNIWSNILSTFTHTHTHTHTHKIKNILKYQNWYMDFQIFGLKPFRSKHWILGYIRKKFMKILLLDIVDSIKAEEMHKRTNLPRSLN